MLLRVMVLLCTESMIHSIYTVFVIFVFHIFKMEQLKYTIQDVQKENTLHIFLMGFYFLLYLLFNLILKNSTWHIHNDAPVTDWDQWSGVALVSHTQLIHVKINFPMFKLWLRYSVISVNILSFSSSFQQFTG